jgi:hypothetical protein
VLRQAYIHDYIHDLLQLVGCNASGKLSSAQFLCVRRELEIIKLEICQTKT